MARRVFFSFYFDEDGWRASQVRNIGRLEADNPVSDNEWEAVKRGGDPAIQRWIDAQMEGKSCCVVLVGASTVHRKWVKYEIEKSWNSKKGVVGIRVHGLKNRFGDTSRPGANPFDLFTLGDQKLSSRVTLYDPPGTDSKAVYDNISSNIERLVEEAIKVRTA
jgi:Thoeris protein ThsB, TIR-like domain